MNVNCAFGYMKIYRNSCHSAQGQEHAWVKTCWGATVSLLLQNIFIHEHWSVSVFEPSILKTKKKYVNINLSNNKPGKELYLKNGVRNLHINKSYNLKKKPSIEFESNMNFQIKFHLKYEYSLIFALNITISSSFCGSSFTLINLMAPHVKYLNAVHDFFFGWICQSVLHVFAKKLRTE